MHFKKSVLILWTLLLVLSACNQQAQGPSLTQIVRTPQPPIELLEIPRRGSIVCSQVPNLDRGEITLWELPGLKSSDPNSAYRGNRGKQVGALRPCTPVAITGYEWSEADREFYVQIEADNLKGWIALSLLNLSD